MNERWESRSGKKRLPQTQAPNDESSQKKHARRLGNWKLEFVDLVERRIDRGSSKRKVLACLLCSSCT